MNHRYLLFLAAALSCLPAPLRAQATNQPPTAHEQLQQLVQQVQTKASAGQHTEADFAAELKTLDSLIASHRDPTSLDGAQSAYMKGVLYLQVIRDHPRTAEAMAFVVTNFPDTDYGHNALALIGKLADSDPDLNTVQAADTILKSIARNYPLTQAGQAAAAMLEKVDAIATSRKIQAGLVVGTAFPDFTTTDLDGVPLSVAALKGKVVLLDFWATWCPVCVAELPSVIETYKKHHAEGFEIIGINLDSVRGKLNEFLQGHKDMTWPQSFNAQDLAAKYGAYQIPFTLLIGPNGKIIAKAIHGPEVEAAVAEALAMQ